MTAERRMVEAAHALACVLPGDTVEAVASAIGACAGKSFRTEIAQRVPHHQHRDAALAFVDRWQAEAKDIDPHAAALALRTAAYSERAHRDSQSVELVWTGPDAGESPCRRTEQAILQVLDAAKNRITLVSFSVYRIPNIAGALVRAANRGVRLNVIVETPDKIEGEGEYSTIRALGREVAARSTVYFWPKENRPVGEKNKVGILHVKCAVADGRWLFLSSANLTFQAFTTNMELGLLLRGGTIPVRVERQFDHLIASGQLQPV
jgi:phosphatidylserine/phosphatidylglycerophosphate/cardiolipin synthase-like enzyme